ncbi:DEAD/DEAH box helicase [Planctomycetota bacterium]
MSTYFHENHRMVDLLPRERVGLRTPQLGATSALIAHDTRSAEAAVVALPTGTGKTAVLQLTPFVWSSGRVLVLTPSRMVREQIVSGFENLELLKNLGVLPKSLDAPSVIPITQKVATAEIWSDLRSADVVITTPMSASPSIDGIATPPSDLFDLVMVDEAHHSPAVSYATLLKAFPNARKAFFTATPFRRDKKIVPGKLVYNYPLKAAIEDGTYGKVEYLPCKPEGNESHDVAIAKHAERVFLADRKKGNDHRMMVRTDSVKRAKEIAKVYESETKLRLKLIEGKHSMGHVRSVIKKLNSGELDGVICVDMFSEGVDFPRLKLAALHAPHKSLAVTLQFIGRFARTNADDIGSAKFIAVPQEIDAEVRELFKSGANWEDLVANLADARVEEEASVRDGLASFETELSADTEEIDITIDSLRPFHHVKVYQTDQEPDLESTPFVPQGCELIYHAVSEDLSAVVVVCQRKTKPKWLETPALQDTKHLLIVIHYNRVNQLLFINSQEHGEELYRSIVESLYDDDSEEVCMPLPHSTISRGLRILNKPSFYNVGMRNRELGGQDESYRTLTGRKADRPVSRTDANTRSRGHVFGGSTDGGAPVTLGVSTLSKLWSNKYELIPRFVDWCHRLAMEIANPDPVATGSNLDLLDTGQRISKIPAPPIGIAWNEHVYKRPQLLSIEGADEDRDLAGLELEIETGSFTEQSVRFWLVIDDQAVARFSFSLVEKKKFKRLDKGEELVVRSSIRDGTLEEFLEVRPPTLFLADFSTLVGSDWYRGATGIPLDPSIIQTFGEFGTTVDIERECENPRSGMRTIVRQAMCT